MVWIKKKDDDEDRVSGGRTRLTFPLLLFFFRLVTRVPARPRPVHLLFLAAQKTSRTRDLVSHTHWRVAGRHIQATRPGLQPGG